METEDSFLFSKPEYVQNYLPNFESMKEKGELCDVIVKAGKVSISAHRVILAAGIPYFKDMFTGPDLEKKSSETEMAEPDPQALVSLVNFVYTGKIEISTENMLSLLSASFFLRVSEIQEACCQFISKRFTFENVMKVRKIAGVLNCGTLVERSDSYITEHFGKFSRTDEFLTMRFSSVKKLIYDDYLGVESEEEVFEAVVKWVESSDSERHSVLPELLKGVRMTLLSPIYLFETVASNERIRASAVCRDLLDEVKFYMLLPEKRHLFSSFSTNPRQSYRRPNPPQSCKKIYAVSTSRLGTSVKFYNAEANKWSLISTNDSCDYFFDVLVHTDKMHLFGGQIFGSFNLKNHEWNKLEPIHEKTHGAGVVLHSDKIYIFGSSLYFLSDQVRCYDVFRNIWLEEGFLIEHRSCPRVVSMDDHIYVAGGYPDVHSSIERYDPKEKKSHSLPSMLNSRQWFGICGLKGRIYVCGGCDEKKDPYYSAEIFDPGSNQWSLICPMGTARYSVSLVSWNNKLYAIGGKKYGGNGTNIVEIYDPDSNLWKFGVSLDIYQDSLTSLRACTG